MLTQRFSFSFQGAFVAARRSRACALHSHIFSRTPMGFGTCPEGKDTSRFNEDEHSMGVEKTQITIIYVEHKRMENEDG